MTESSLLGVDDEDGPILLDAMLAAPAANEDRLPEENFLMTSFKADTLIPLMVDEKRLGREDRSKDRIVTSACFGCCWLLLGVAVLR